LISCCQKNRRASHAETLNLGLETVNIGAVAVKIGQFRVFKGLVLKDYE
jgi:hypothetical protein